MEILNAVGDTFEARSWESGHWGEAPLKLIIMIVTVKLLMMMMMKKKKMRRRRRRRRLIVISGKVPTFAF